MPWYLRDYLVGVFSMSLMIFAASNSGSMIHRALAWRPLTFVGMFGYSLYLMHAPCLQLLSQYVIGPLGLPPILAFCSLVLVGTPAIVLLCYVF
jgi:peptidoglycan/LPS O-acetylase OafA/YrhL